jgi:hypothetical protein
MLASVAAFIRAPPSIPLPSVYLPAKFPHLSTTLSSFEDRIYVMNTLPEKTNKRLMAAQKQNLLVMGDVKVSKKAIPTIFGVAEPH